MRSAIIEVLRQIVVDTPYAKCGGINTFLFLDDVKDVEKKNFGQTFQSYKEGAFWSRDWIASGANPNNIAVKYPVLVVEQRNSTQKTIDTKVLCSMYSLVVIDQINCTDCPKECQRTPEKIESDTILTLQNYLFELSRYCQADWTLLDGTQKSGFVSKGRLEYWLQNGIITGYNVKRKLTALLQSEQFEFNSFGEGFTGQIRGTATSFSVCMCWQSNTQVAYNYIDTPISQIATVKCDTC
jgi:hypothetical protein